MAPIDEAIQATITMRDVALIVIRVLALLAVGGLVYGMYTWHKAIWDSEEE